MISLEKATPFSPKRSEKNTTFKNQPLPVHINMTTLQPSQSPRTFHERVNSINKDSTRMKSQQHFFKSQIKDVNETNQIRGDRIQTNPFKSDYQSMDKKIINSPKKTFENEFQIFKPFPTSPQIKDIPDRTFNPRQIHFTHNQPPK